MDSKLLIVFLFLVYFAAYLLGAIILVLDSGTLDELSPLFGAIPAVTSDIRSEVLGLSFVSFLGLAAGFVCPIKHISISKYRLPALKASPWIFLSFCLLIVICVRPFVPAGYVLFNAPQYYPFLASLSVYFSILLFMSDGIVNRYQWLIVLVFILVYLTYGMRIQLMPLLFSLSLVVRNKKVSLIRVFFLTLLLFSLFTIVGQLRFTSFSLTSFNFDLIYIAEIFVPGVSFLNFLADAPARDLTSLPDLFLDSIGQAYFGDSLSTSLMRYIHERQIAPIGGIHSFISFRFYGGAAAPLLAFISYFLSLYTIRTSLNTTGLSIQRVLSFAMACSFILVLPRMAHYFWLNNFMGLLRGVSLLYVSCALLDHTICATSPFRQKS